MTACIIVLAGCAGQATVDGAWQEGASRNESFSRILVVGLSPNASARCDFESFMVTQIRATGTDAKASCVLMKTSEPITEASVEQAIDDFSADAVLATVLVHAEQEAEEGGDRETRGGAYFKPTGVGYAYPYYRGRYGRWGVPVVYGEYRLAPVIGTVDGEVQIRSMLYQVQDATLIYEMITTADDLTGREDALASITPPIASQLRRAGLLAATR